MKIGLLLHSAGVRGDHGGVFFEHGHIEVADRGDGQEARGGSRQWARGYGREGEAGEGFQLVSCPGVEGEDDGHMLRDCVQGGHDGGQACGVIRILGPVDCGQGVGARGQAQDLENRAVFLGLGGVE